MFLKVKRLQSLTDLLLETELIEIGGEANDLINREKASNQHDTNSQEEGPSNEDIDKLLDHLFSLGEDDLTNRLNDPSFSRIFSELAMKTLLLKYFDYLRNRISTFRTELTTILNSNPVNESKVKSITNKITTFVCRVRVIEIIYQKKAANKKSTDYADFSKEINEKVKEINDELYKLYSLTIMIPAEKTKASYSRFQGAQTDEEKTKAAADIYEDIQTAEILSEDMPDEVTSGITIARQDYERRIESELGKEVADDIKAGIYVNKNIATLIRRIFEFQYTNWTNESDILTEANKLRTSINGFPDVSTEAKEYLLRIVDHIQADLLKRAKDKQFNTKKYKGIHYDFEKMMPLYERTLLPITGKQIADDTRIMKFRKASQVLMGLIFGASDNDSVASRAFAKTGAWAHTLYAKTLNGAAKLIGKAVNGREGEMKADAYTRLFILDTSVVDKPKTKQISEEGESPGVSPQVPGSIGGMGPIIPPTSNSIGSGDNFNMRKKKKSAVLGFHDFLKEHNLKK